MPERASAACCVKREVGPRSWAMGDREKRARRVGERARQEFEREPVVPRLPTPQASRCVKNSAEVARRTVPHHAWSLGDDWNTWAHVCDPCACCETAVFATI